MQLEVSNWRQNCAIGYYEIVIDQPSEYNSYVYILDGTSESLISRILIFSYPRSPRGIHGIYRVVVKII